MEKVLLIGGASGQCHAVDILHEMGYYVLVLDYDKDCLGAKLADEFYAISTADTEAIYELAKEKQVISVLAVQSDLGMIVASKVSERLQLRSIPFEKARLFTNKYLMRDFLKANGFRYPHYKRCQSKAEVQNFVQEYGFPFVVKPLDSQGSRGVCIVHSQEEMVNLEEIVQYNRDASGIIVEEFLEGEEYTVEGIVVDGKHTTLAVSKKHHYENLACVSDELYYNWSPEYDELIQEHNTLINLTEIPFAVTHSEYIRTSKGFTLVEFAARGGGARIASHIVPAVSGCDAEKVYIEQALGKKVQLSSLTRKYAVLKFVHLEEKKIKSITGLDKIQKDRHILHIELEYNVGDIVKPVINDTNRHGHYIATADTESELQEVMKMVENELVIVYE